VAASFLLKGSPRNVSWSLADMVYRRTDLLRGKPERWMLWGVNERFQWVLKALPGSEVFLYVTKGAGTGGGLALCGTARELLELREPYWPEGTWTKAFYLEVEAVAPGVLESPEDPSSWRLVPMEELRKVGVRVLPGPQRLEEGQARALASMLRRL